MVCDADVTEKIDWRPLDPAIVALRAQRLSWAVVADRVGVDRRAVLRRASWLLGLPVRLVPVVPGAPVNGTRWTTDARLVLHEMAESTAADVARALGRTTKAVQQERHRMRVSDGRVPTWTT